MPARAYELPTSDKIDFYKENKDNFIKNIDYSISKSVSSKYTGISKIFICNLIDNLNISDTDYTQADLIKVYETISNIISNLGTNNLSIIEKDNNYYLLNIPNNQTLQANFFLDDYYSKKEKEQAFITYKNSLLKLVLTGLKKISNKLNNINNKLKECKNMETYRIYGEIITSNLYRLDDVKRDSNIILNNYYDDNNEIVIPLDNTISISYNAKKYFKKYHKLKNTFEIVSTQKLEAENELNYLESIVYELECASSIDELDEIYEEINENSIFKKTEKSNVKKNKINKRKVHDTFEPLTYNVDGFTLYVGKNNKQNDYITTKLGKGEDIWFHTKDIRGSHCLLKCNGTNPKENTIYTCAQIAAFYSKAKLSSNVPVDYCFASHVKKPHVAKPGMVIYTNQKTLFVEPKIPN